MDDICIGNAAKEAPDHRGWFIGSFMDQKDIRHSDDVEVKWGEHKKGADRGDWAPGSDVYTVSILVYGTFTIKFRDKDVTLKERGDYVMWGPGIEHSRHADEDAATITVRWKPSK